MGRAETARKGNTGQEEEPLVALDPLGFTRSRNGIMDQSGSNLHAMPRLVVCPHRTKPRPSSDIHLILLYTS
jgi:hypothetical protein